MLFIFLRVFPHFSVRFSFLLNSGHHRGGQSQNEHNTIPLFSQTIIFSRACTSEALFALPLFFSSLQPTNVLLAKLFFFLGASIQWPLGHSFFSVAPQNDPRGTQAPPWGIFHLTKFLHNTSLGNLSSSGPILTEKQCTTQKHNKFPSRNNSTSL